MKFKTNAKELKQGYHKIISVGYCDLQSLLSYESPIAYSEGTYGWNFDVYDIDGIAIVTGYRSIPSKNSEASYDLIKEYEDKSQGKTKEEKRELLREFIQKSIQ